MTVQKIVHRLAMTRCQPHRYEADVQRVMIKDVGQTWRSERKGSVIDTTFAGGRVRVDSRRIDIWVASSLSIQR